MCLHRYYYLFNVIVLEQFPNTLSLGLYEFVYVISEGLLKEDMLMLSFYPDLKEVSITSGGEYIFVIDRSGRYTALTVCFTRGGILVLYNCDVSFAIYLHFLWYGMHLDILMICIISTLGMSTFSLFSKSQLDKALLSKKES